MASQATNPPTRGSMDMLQPILIDSHDFVELRTNQCIYVDKTAYLYGLISCRDARRFFLARPRRFGKSMMISTLKAIFDGCRELFDGLAISKTDWKWEKYPVLNFDLSLAAADSANRFERNFIAVVKSTLMEVGIAYDTENTPEINFGMAIDKLAETSDGKGVVILIDEYDDPVAQLLDQPMKRRMYASCWRRSINR